MLDFETLDTKPSAAVLSLGAVIFDKEKIVATKYYKFKLQEQLDSGRTVSADTLRWWLRQGNMAQNVLDASDVDCDSSLIYYLLDTFLADNEVDTSTLKVWGNGADFDLPILTNLCADNGSIWKHWNSRCFRTFSEITDCKKLVARKGTHHHALDDAIYQTRCVLAHWKY